MFAVSAATWMTLHILRPEAFPPGPFVGDLLRNQYDVFVHLDLGRSREAPGLPVMTMIRQGLPADIALIAGGIVVGVGLGLAGGAVAAVRAGSLVSRALQSVALIFLCVPVYWFGLMMLLFFGPGIGFVELPFITVPGAYRSFGDEPLAWAKSLLLPWFVVGLPLAAMCLRMMRASMQEALGADFLRTAESKGLSRVTVMRRHAMPVAAMPVVSLAGTQMAVVVANALLVEQVFNIPGVLRHATDGLNDGNFELLQGITLTGAAFVVVANLISDVVQGCLDPRVRE